MPRSRVLVPETKRIDLSGGDWIVVKTRLTYGETKSAHKAVVDDFKDGRVIPNFEILEIAQAVAYIVDWSMVDPQNKRIPIDTDDQKRRALASFDQDSVKEIVDAVAKHIDAMESEKNVTAADGNSSSTSSPSAA